MTDSEKQQESMAVFICGEIMGVCSLLNYNALERFLSSDRSKGDFRYAKECEAILELYGNLYPTRKPIE